MATLQSVTLQLAEKLQLQPTDQEQTGESKPECYYTLTERTCHIHDMTIHTLRQAWLLLVHSLDYKFDAYLEPGAAFPDVKPFFKYTKFSSMMYTYNYAVGLVLCDVVKYEWHVANKKGFGKGTGRPKPEPLALVVLALAVLPKYRGVNISKRLFDYTVKKAADARIFKIFALADGQGAALYSKLGFTPSEESPLPLTDITATQPDGSPCELSVMEFTIVLARPLLEVPRLDVAALRLAQEDAATLRVVHVKRVPVLVPEQEPRVANDEQVATRTRDGDVDTPSVRDEGDVRHVLDVRNYLPRLDALEVVLRDPRETLRSLGLVRLAVYRQHVRRRELLQTLLHHLAPTHVARAHGAEYDNLLLHPLEAVHRAHVDQQLRHLRPGRLGLLLLRRREHELRVPPRDRLLEQHHLGRVRRYHRDALLQRAQPELRLRREHLQDDVDELAHDLRLHLVHVRRLVLRLHGVDGVEDRGTQQRELAPVVLRPLVDGGRVLELVLVKVHGGEAADERVHAVLDVEQVHRVPADLQPLEQRAVVVERDGHVRAHGRRQLARVAHQYHAAAADAQRDQRRQLHCLRRLVDDERVEHPPVREQLVRAARRERRADDVAVAQRLGRQQLPRVLAHLGEGRAIL
ncbi:GNAT family N-acetyltransferase [Babesia caballi]|uniref:GNAT family N-acetyltransferase n=1 Tax=Babesia caballi TaxID=5871 RepID=A0AAV4LNR6_BABCB|nr:GNAT family N-acetyltransferase [Babesia caballi]